jgi:hypothetical protein
MNIVAFREFIKEEDFIFFELAHSCEDKVEFIFKTNRTNLVEIVIFKRIDDILTFYHMYVCHTDSYENTMQDMIIGAFKAQQFYTITPHYGNKCFILPLDKSL